MKSADDSGRPPSIMLRASTFLWFPISSRTAFYFLLYDNSRNQWNILFTEVEVKELVPIDIGHDTENCVYLL